MDLKKIIFISTLPRSSGNKIFDMIKQYPNVVSWPFEFLYFDFFKKISKGKKLIKAEKLNIELKNIFYKKKAKINVNLFFKILEKNNNKLVTKINYLFILYKALSKVLKINKDNKKKYFLMFITARGFDWSCNKLLEKCLFIFSDRDIHASFFSLKRKIYSQSNELEFYNPKNSKNFIYWVKEYIYMIKNLKQKTNIINHLILKFDNYNLDANQKEKIFKLNKEAIENFLKIKKKIENNSKKKLVYVNENLKINKFDKLCLDYVGIKMNIISSFNKKNTNKHIFIIKSFFYFFYENFKIVFLFSLKKNLLLIINYFWTINKILSLKKL